MRYIQNSKWAKSIWIFLILFLSGFSKLQADNISVTLTWVAPGDDGNIGTAAQYDIRYSFSPINEANWNSAIQVLGEPSPRPAGSNERFTITGLNSNQVYYFAIKTADEVPNWSGISNLASVSTYDSIPPMRIIDLAADSGSHNGEIALSWTATGDDSLAGTAAYYQIAFSQDSAVTANWDNAEFWNSPPQPLPAGQTQSTLLYGLEPGEKYWIAIKAFDDMSNSSEISNVAGAIAKLVIISEADDDEGDVIPESYTLSQNYPNPFNPITRINYSVPKESHVQIKVFNICGRYIATLVDETKSVGSYTAVWDGKNFSGFQVPSGVYLYKIKAGDFIDYKKMVLMK